MPGIIHTEARYIYLDSKERGQPSENIIDRIKQDAFSIFGKRVLVFIV